MLTVIISLLWINGRSESSKIKAVEPEISGEYSITDNTYKSWSAEELGETREDVKKFLEEQEDSPIEDTECLYKNNGNWTEGALQALDKVYKSSLVAMDGRTTSPDLARQLLIESVPNLKIKNKTTDLLTKHWALNNYPDDTIRCCHRVIHI